MTKRHQEIFRWISVLLTIIWLLIRGHNVEIVNNSDIRLEWDAVTTLSNGTEIPAEDVITYEVFLDGELKGSTAETFLDLTLESEGQYTLSVRTVREKTGGMVERSSEVMLEATLIFSPSAPINLIITRRQ